MKKWFIILFSIVSILSLSAYYSTRINSGPFLSGRPSFDGEDETHYLYERRNKKFGVTVLFFGRNLEKLQSDIFAIELIPSVIFGKKRFPLPQKIQSIDYILIVKEETGEVIKRKLYEITITGPGQKFWPELWSPNKEHLVLPKSKQASDGFIFYNAKTVIEDMKQEKYSDALSIQGKGSGAYFLQVLKWEGPSSFSLSATLSDTSDAYQYDIKTKRLHCFGTGCSKDGYASNNEAENSTGLIKIEELPQRRPLPQPPLSAR
jgi:hypothetical protein